MVPIRPNEAARLLLAPGRASEVARRRVVEQLINWCASSASRTDSSHLNLLVSEYLPDVYFPAFVHYSTNSLLGRSIVGIEPVEWFSSAGVRSVELRVSFNLIPTLRIQFHPTQSIMLVVM